MSSIKMTILALVAGRLFSPARVTRVDTVSERFRFIELQSDAFRNVTWEPAAKVALFVNGYKRVYTPVSIDNEQGLMKILTYVHGSGPGSSWAASAKISDECRYFGPQPSLALSSLNNPYVLFGDETSFAAASTLQTRLGSGVESRLIFEVLSPTQAQVALDAVGLNNATLFERSPDGSHLNRVAKLISQSLSEVGARSLILTGCGPSIQTLRRFLKTSELALSKNKVKAYWAPGKEGLD